MCIVKYYKFKLQLCAPKYIRLMPMSKTSDAKNIIIAIFMRVFYLTPIHILLSRSNSISARI